MAHNRKGESMARRLTWWLGMTALVPVLVVPTLAASDPKDTKKDDKKPQKPIVAVFRLNGSLTETPADDSFSLTPDTGTTLKSLVERLRKAKNDAAVKAVVILPETSIGSAQTEEIRQAMAEVRSAGKDVYVHADSLSMREYVLASGASRLSVVPTADLWITGLYGESPYVRRLLDKLGVKPDFLHCGAYKSAAEIFMREGPSPEAEKMQNWLLDSTYDTFIKLIARGRNVDTARVRSWIDGGPYTAEKARTAGLVDAVESWEDFQSMLQSKYGKNVVFEKKYGKKKPPKVDFSSPLAMFSIWADILGEATKKKSTKPAVGIVYVDGAISLGGGGPASPFGAEGAASTPIRKALDEAARDDAIKAVVLRVDSPGGSATASEVILEATRRVKAKKPLVVSMGDVAGSGGYYVACAADTIFADDATITGSIGVVGGKFATNGLWNKLGITFKSYKRGENAGLLSSESVFSEPERARMQAWMDEIYGVFKGHVVAIRGKKLKKPIDELAGGRVYTGRQALELGLVDRIGTLEDAINFAAKEAKLAEHDVRVVPEPKNFIERLMDELTGEQKDEPHEIHAGKPVSPVSGTSIVDLALPYLQHLDPERVRVIRMALQRMQLIQQEGAVLMMPEFQIAR
jgi:protease IV